MNIAKIMFEIEMFLEGKNVTIPDERRTGELGESRLFGDSYYELERQIYECFGDNEEHSMALGDAFECYHIGDYEFVGITSKEGYYVKTTRREAERIHSLSDIVVTDVKKDGEGVRFVVNGLKFEPDFRNFIGKDLRIAFLTEIDGEQKDITIPMEYWCADWKYNKSIISNDDVHITAIDLDGISILEQIQAMYKHISMAAISEILGWDETVSNFEKAHNGLKSTGTAFRQWTKGLR